ncbi:MAG TPA: XdhC family protein [Sporichthyaceae bacterium]|jgi:xanthine/CO dehydrogenase XdhC/CoxF family maturation factor|nr:XdhC family protein [Sporichthyaceae bacterium]
MAIDVTPTEIIPDACLVAHGAEDETPPPPRSMVVVYAGQTGQYLAAFAAACDYRVTVVEPDPGMAARARSWAPDLVEDVAATRTDNGTDVVVTDHHRHDLGTVLRDALKVPSRWVGVVGNPRLVGPHVHLLAELGVPPEEVARVHRPIGLNIGSRSPAEIAISTLAGLLADRAAKPGGFDFSP